MLIYFLKWKELIDKNHTITQVKTYAKKFPEKDRND